VQFASDWWEVVMAKDSDDTKPTIEDVDRVIREHERKDVARQDIKKAIKEHTGVSSSSGRAPLTAAI
jgi:hypothetical protein